jgi:hypothetical protein
VPARILAPWWPLAQLLQRLDHHTASSCTAPTKKNPSFNQLLKTVDLLPVGCACARTCAAVAPCTAAAAKSHQSSTNCLHRYKISHLWDVPARILAPWWPLAQLLPQKVIINCHYRSKLLPVGCACAHTCAAVAPCAAAAAKVIINCS